MLEDYVVIDLEMTGLNAKTDAILEVGAVRVRDGRQTETYGAILKCGRELSERVVELTGITPEMAARVICAEGLCDIIYVNQVDDAELSPTWAETFAKASNVPVVIGSLQARRWRRLA